MLRRLAAEAMDRALAAEAEEKAQEAAAAAAEAAARGAEPLVWQPARHIDIAEWAAEDAATQDRKSVV